MKQLEWKPSTKRGEKNRYVAEVDLIKGLPCIYTLHYEQGRDWWKLDVGEFGTQTFMTRKAAEQAAEEIAILFDKTERQYLEIVESYQAEPVSKRERYEKMLYRLGANAIVELAHSHLDFFGYESQIIDDLLYEITENENERLRVELEEQYKNDDGQHIPVIGESEEDEAEADEQ